MHGCSGLKNRCLDLVISSKRNFEKAAVTEGYSRLAQLFPSLIREIEEHWKWVLTGSSNAEDTTGKFYQDCDRPVSFQR
jgi:hypothetical protein